MPCARGPRRVTFPSIMRTQRAQATTLVALSILMAGQASAWAHATDATRVDAPIIHGMAHLFGMGFHAWAPAMFGAIGSWFAIWSRRETASHLFFSALTMSYALSHGILWTAGGWEFAFGLILASFLAYGFGALATVISMKRPARQRSRARARRRP